MSHGQLGSGPAYWTVQSKSGLVIELGNCDTSCIVSHQTSGALVWAVNRVSDTLGNFFNVVYKRDTTDIPDPNVPDSIDYRPLHIDYTGNNKTGLKPYLRVKFEYTSRPDQSFGFMSGVKVHSTKLLKKIGIYYTGSGSDKELYTCLLYTSPSPRDA